VSICCQQIAPYSDTGYDYLSTMILDTTAQHGRHFFDVNCQICTGKIPDPMYDEEHKITGLASSSIRSAADDRRDDFSAISAAVPDFSRDPRRSKAATTSSPVNSNMSKVSGAKPSAAAIAVAPPAPTYPLLLVLYLFVLF
jgi:hypothetical protein